MGLGEAPGEVAWGRLQLLPETQTLAVATLGAPSRENCRLVGGAFTRGRTC